MPLTPTESRLLEAFCASLSGLSVSWETVSSEDWQSLIRLAAAQKILPLVLEAIYPCKAAAEADLIIRQCRLQSIRSVMSQTQKTAQFLKLYAYLQNHGMRPLVVKGILCRSLYQKSDHRDSSDEDLLVRTEDFSDCCAVLKDYGMIPTDPEADPQTALEIGFRKENSPLYIELHRRLFAENNTAAEALNAHFVHCFEHITAYPVSRTVSVESLCPQDHLLYLILHAYKHFIHSGFGIRQVCDIGLWAKAYQNEINWNQLYTDCAALHAAPFASAVFQIAKQHLAIEVPLSSVWEKLSVDPAPMLSDLLSGGIYGATDRSRLHAGTVTMQAFEARYLKSGNGLMRTLFPDKKSLEKRYPYLKKHGILLPAAWVSRFWQYGGELLSAHGKSSAAESLQTAKERMELLRYYKIIR